jgi:NarL family two-component system response regulator LiaR
MRNLPEIGPKISIIVVDDEDLARAAMVAFLERIGDFRIVGQVADGRQALSMIRSLRPDVALVDVVMPGLNGIEMTARLNKNELTTAVVLISGYCDDEIPVRAMDVGAAGFLLKGSAPQELEVAIRAAHSGRRYVTPAASRAFLSRSSSRPIQPEAQTLTLRHREVLQLLVEGKVSKEIAGDLGVSVKTVEKHRAQLIRRCGVRNTAELVARAVRQRLIPAE